VPSLLAITALVCGSKTYISRADEFQVERTGPAEGIKEVYWFLSVDLGGELGDKLLDLQHILEDFEVRSSGSRSPSDIIPLHRSNNTHNISDDISSNSLPCVTTTSKRCIQLKYPSWILPARLDCPSLFLFCSISVLCLIHPSKPSIPANRNHQNSHLNRHQQQPQTLRMRPQIPLKPLHILRPTNRPPHTHPRAPNPLLRAPNIDAFPKRPTISLDLH
jgi:hypothetical protein